MPARELSTILVHVDDTRQTATRLALARGLAQRHGAKLVCAYVSPARIAPATLFGRTGTDWDRTIEAALAATEGHARDHFAAFSPTMPAAEWLHIDGNQPGGLSDPPSLLAQAARRADLAIVGLTGTGEDHKDAPGRFAEGLIVESGRPVLVVPEGGPPASIGETVTIAWSERRETARAVADAIPLLRQARQVEVVEIAPPEASPGEIAAVRQRLESVVAFLGRHRIQALSAVEVASGPTLADQLLIRAAERGSDLIVAGAYGHARLREFVFGGFTHDLLSRSRIPILASH